MSREGGRRGGAKRCGQGWMRGWKGERLRLHAINHLAQQRCLSRWDGGMDV